MASKEVLMSKRSAAMDSIDAARHTSGYVQSAPSYQPPPISNYKGVMLCDRPTTKFGAKTYGDGQNQMPFSCAIGPGTKYEALGLNPSKEQRALKLASEGKTRPKDTNDFMSKHKQWLAGLNKQRQLRQQEDEMAIQNAIDKTKKFKEYAAKLRANIRQAKEEHEEVLSESALGNHLKESSKENTASNSSNKKAKKQKPVWALTEEEKDGREEEELDDLLQFASGLNFDKYIEDYEVRNALAAVKDRISQLSQGKNIKVPSEGSVDLDAAGEDWKKAFLEGWNQGRDGSNENERLGTSHSQRSDKSFVSRHSSKHGKEDDEMDDARSVASDVSNRDVDLETAEKVLRNSHNMRQIHSSRSIRKILEKNAARQARKEGLQTVQEDEDIPDVGVSVPPPVTQVYTKDDQGLAAGGGRKDTKKNVDPSNLPYLHRNPAV